MGLKVCLDGLKGSDEKKAEVKETTSRDDEPTARQTPVPPDVVPAGEVNTAAEMPKSATSEMDDLCREYARADAREKAAKKAKEKFKKKLLHIFEKRDITEHETLEGKFLVVVTRDSKGIIVARAKEFLTEEQIEACTGVTRKGSTSLKFYSA